MIYLLHYLCLLCFESQHCTEDDVGELMLAGKEKATLVQLRNISAGLWSTNLDFLHQLNEVTAPERNNILITIVIAMITFHWLTSDCHHECIDPVTDDEVHLTRNLSSAASIMLTLTGRFIEDMTDNLYLNILNDYK